MNYKISILAVLAFSFLFSCSEDKSTGPTSNTNTQFIETVLIPAGTFQMGNTGVCKSVSDESKVHTVTLTRSFLMSKYEITQKQYVAIVGNNPSHDPNDKKPVEQVKWEEAIDFCNKLSERDSLEKCYSGSGQTIKCNFDANGYRLPTEAEWEYACKANTLTDIYNGNITNLNCSPTDATLDKIGWYCANSGDETHEVGLKQPNAFGLYDMIGNVLEYCWDGWEPYYDTNPVTDPQGDTDHSFNILRGGSLMVQAIFCRSCSRSWSMPIPGYETRYYNAGFRVVRNK